MVTLILVIAVKLAKQCTTHASPSGTSSAASSASASSASAPAAEYPAHVQGRGVCQAGFRPDQNGNCVKDF
jgi:hypothetical protein